MAAIAWTEPALGSVSKVRLLRALAAAPRRWFSEAELARAIRMSPNTVNLALRELRAARLLEAVDAGRAHAVRLDASSFFADALRRLFATEERAVGRLRRAVRRVLAHDETCILFGSAARGDNVGSSDVDLLVVAPSRDRAAAASVRIEDAASRVLPGRYRLIHYTPSEIRKKWKRPLLRAVRAEGVPLGRHGLEAFR